MVAAPGSAGHVLKAVVPSVVDGKEELEVIDLCWIEAQAEVGEEGGIAAFAQGVILVLPPLVVDTDFEHLARPPDRAEGKAVVGVVQRVEAGVDLIVAVVFVFV